MTHEKEPLWARTEPSDAIAKRLLCMSSTSFWRWEGMVMFPRKNDLLRDTLVSWCWNECWKLACWALAGNWMWRGTGVCGGELVSGSLVCIWAWSLVVRLWIWFVSRSACTSGCATLEGAWKYLTLDCHVVDLMAYLVITTNGSQCVTVNVTYPLGSMEECVVVG